MFAIAINPKARVSKVGLTFRVMVVTLAIIAIGLMGLIYALAIPFAPGGTRSDPILVSNPIVSEKVWEPETPVVWTKDRDGFMRLASQNPTYVVLGGTVQYYTQVGLTLVRYDRQITSPSWRYGVGSQWVVDGMLTSEFTRTPGLLFYLIGPPIVLVISGFVLFFALRFKRYEHDGYYGYARPASGWVFKLRKFARRNHSGGHA